ncbi:unnamed protein product [Mycena citricolor]|uniref:coproporphyrinogen oxidase n=1 Tax=Mycena citricolor TaxID=2018698 RepID=A0AAD2HZH4_9AGAR|nr:unnamed protein product [Mycena citricolor]CAK5284146.1 unnamed protein product [Mycena citricolor]
MTDSKTRPMSEQFKEFVQGLQEKIVTTFESLDPNAPPFKRDSWVRPGAGGIGQSCVFSMPQQEDGLIAHESLLEKAGVNISIIQGSLPPAAIKQMRADHTSMPLPENPEGGLPYFVAGISLVIHPRNPNAPTVHANYRYFEISEPVEEGSTEAPKLVAWWFGGGSDLTPSYLFEEDAKHFHTTIKAACDAHGAGLYPGFKKWCDEYFYIPHRKEARGIGGIFFDDLNEGSHLRLDNSEGRPRTQADIFALAKALGDSFLPSYVPILTRRSAMTFTPLQRRWQLVRRGRYVEFNLIVDRGTKFGLMSPAARIESIFISLPEIARWEYMTDLGGEGTEEGKLVEVLVTPREWA